ncbi:MAG TPA: VOC family protein [Longimicrobiaceae bacterium]|nr:VOC family protein [Longimicrobiaceae bacterium]
MSNPRPQVTPFLMFEGRAEEAMTFYLSLFDGAVESIERYGPEGPGPEGSVLVAAFTLAGQRFLCIDSWVKHAFTFTPSVSLHVVCASEAEIDERFARLSEDGAVLMPLGEYPFSPRYGWLQDRFGVSWQLTLPPA